MASARAPRTSRPSTCCRRPPQPRPERRCCPVWPGTWPPRSSTRTPKALAAAALEEGADVDDPAVRWQVYLADGIAWLGTEAGHEALTESCRLATAVGVATASP